MTETLSHRPRYGAANPRRRAIGWAAVIVLHAIILWALVTGTARKGLELIKKPLEAVVIQEVIIPPPPPPPPPPKKIEKAEPRVEKAPPPPFIPPPEVTPPVTSAPAIQSVQTPPPAPPVIAPPPPPAPPAPVGPKRTEMAVACPTQVKPEMQRAATKDRVSGVVVARALIRDGAVREVTIVSGPRVFHNVVREAMMQYKCVSDSGDVSAQQEFNFTQPE
jgi:protein TonB